MAFLEHPARRWLAAIATFGIIAIAAQPMPFPIPSIASLGLAAAPLILAFHLRRSHPRSDLRATWDILAIGLSAWWLADLITLIITITLPAQIGERTIADLVRLVGYLLVALGVWRYPMTQRASSSRSLRVWIDIILVIGSAAAIFYDLKFRSLLETSAPLSERVWDTAYPLFGLFLIIVASVAILRAPALGVSSSWFVLAIGSICVASLTVIGGQLLIGVAAVIAEALNENDPPQPGSLRARLTLLAQRIVPVMAVLALFTETIIIQIALSQINEIGLFLAILFSSLLVVRQGMLLGENEFQRYAQLVNSASDAAFICKQNGQMVLANPAAYNLLNLSRSAPLKKQFLSEAFQPSSPDNGQMLIAATQREWRGEGSAFLRTHPITLALALNALRDDAGAVNGLVGVARDITERQHMESKLRSLNVQLLEAQDRLLRLNADLERRVNERTADLTDANRELEEKNVELQTLDQLKTEFVSLVSHELRAPLTNINGGLELLLSKDGGMSLDSREALALMSREGRRLTRLVEAILDLSTFDAGQLPVSITSLSLHSLIHSVVEQFQASGSPARLTLDVPPTLPRAFADERGLRSSLTQLVDNALKYAPESSIEILARCDEDQVEVRVADHGSGIPPEHREKVFERFHRVNPSDSQNVYGYGLGLHTTRRFIEAMNGTITFEETPGGGSTFCIKLKVANHSTE
ncbi:MAG: ATP-binding protein [Chloroflexota bacterium]